MEIAPWRQHIDRSGISEQIIIEKFSPASSGFIVELIKRNLEPFEQSAGVIVSTFRRLDNLDDVYNKEGAYFFVARDGDQYIGGVGLGPLHGLPVSEGFGEIRDLVLEKNYRGRGIGARLLAVAIDKAVSLGYKKLYLETTPNMVTAQKLFRSCGFRPVTSRPSNETLAPTNDKIECYYLLEITKK